MICQVMLALAGLGVSAHAPTPAQTGLCLESLRGLSGVAGVLPDCDAPDTDPWVSEVRDRLIASNALVVYAIVAHGMPSQCEGEVTTEFDGAKYGRVTLHFEGGVTFNLETMPLETSVVTLRAEAGFTDAVEARRLLESYADGVGVRIGWDNPEEETVGEELVRSFIDPEPGFNASASLTFLGGRLVALRFSMAL